MMKDVQDHVVLGKIPTRRQAIVGAAVALGAVALRPAIWAATPEEISHTAESIHQEPVFQAISKRVYDALTDAKQFDKVMHLSAAMQSGMALPKAPTEISKEAGGAFSIYGGYIVGRQIELVPGKRIVQAWRVVEWNPGVYSLVRFELVDQNSGTKLIFDHIGFPSAEGEHLAAGWKSNYWEPLAKFLA